MGILHPPLAAFDKMARQIEQATKRVLVAVRGKPIHRRPMTALALRRTVDRAPTVFDNPDIGARFGTAPRR